MILMDTPFAKSNIYVFLMSACGELQWSVNQQKPPNTLQAKQKISNANVVDLAPTYFDVSVNVASLLLLISVISNLEIARSISLLVASRASRCHFDVYPNQQE